jgi:hypothetical protein
METNEDLSISEKAVRFVTEKDRSLPIYLFEEFFGTYNVNKFSVNEAGVSDLYRCNGYSVTASTSVLADYFVEQSGFVFRVRDDGNTAKILDVIPADDYVPCLMTDLGLDISDVYLGKDTFVGDSLATFDVRCANVTEDEKTGRAVFDSYIIKSYAETVSRHLGYNDTENEYFALHAEGVASFDPEVGKFVLEFTTKTADHHNYDYKMTVIDKGDGTVSTSVTVIVEYVTDDNTYTTIKSELTFEARYAGARAVYCKIKLKNVTALEKTKSGNYARIVENKSSEYEIDCSDRSHRTFKGKNSDVVTQYSGTQRSELERSYRYADITRNGDKGSFMLQFRTDSSSIKTLSTSDLRFFSPTDKTIPKRVTDAVFKRLENVKPEK